MLAQRVVIKTRQGDVTGLIGSKPPHILSDEERKKLQEPKDMYIDVGATSSSEAKELGHLPRRSHCANLSFHCLRNR